MDPSLLGSDEFSNKLSCLLSMLVVNFGICRLHSIERILKLASVERNFSIV